MTLIDQLAEQHIQEYASKLKKIDKLLDRAGQATQELQPEHPLKSEVANYRKERSELPKKKDLESEKWIDHWRENMIASAGPMAVWDILAQKLEDLVERIEKDQ